MQDVKNSALTQNAVLKHFSALRETLLPYQTISQIAWVFTGICSTGTVPKILHDSTIWLVLACVIFARFSGMCWNRLVDLKFDAKNPRTSLRALPSRRMSSSQMALYALLFLSLFLAICLYFPPFERFIGASVALAVLLYSFLKRWTVICHFFLGALYSLLPIAGSFWQAGRISLPSFFLALAAFCSVCGCDILYSLQDEEFDRRYGLFSLPAKWGGTKSLEIACGIHGVAFVCVAYALFHAHVGGCGFFVWFVGTILMLIQWRKMWLHGFESVRRTFPFLLISSSLVPVASLAVDWISKLFLTFS